MCSRRRLWLVALAVSGAVLSGAGPRAALAAATAPLSIGRPLPPVPPTNDIRATSPQPRAGARIISEEREPRANGRVFRVQVLATAASPYPIRAEELIQRGPNGEEVAIARLEMAAGHLLAQAGPGANNATVPAVLKAAGIVAVRPMNSAGLVRIELADSTPRAVPRALVALQTAKNLFTSAEPDYLVRTTLTDPTDPAYVSGEQWALRNTGQSGGLPDADIDADEAWDTRREATNIIVAVVDTGIRYTHQDLAPNMWSNAGEIPGDGVDNDGNGVIDDVYGYNAITRGGNPNDDHFHGTHVAGIIGARGNNGLGVSGVAWRVRLMAVKFLTADGSGFTSDAVLGIDYARRMGAHIMNNSWGGGGYSQALADAIERARQAGIIFVAAAGNNATSDDVLPFYPAAYPHDNVLTVAASTRSDTLASFSNHGLRTVDIAAPGAAIYSTYNTSDSAYQTLSGTSMAAPHISGAMALLKAQFPGATHAQLIDRVLATADHRPAFSGSVRAEGRLNLARALTATTIVPLPFLVQQPQPNVATNGGSAMFTVQATGGVTLSYQWRRSGIDLAGATAASLTLSNVQPTDAGNYSVLVRNSSGVTLSEEAKLTVVQPVRILAQPLGATLAADATFSVQVVASGDQPIHYQWRKGNVEIPGATEATFAIYGVTAADAANYTVRVTNLVNAVDSAPAVLVVVLPPTIVAPPQDQIAALGDNVSFSVSATGSLPLACQWFKDGAPIGGATMTNLALNNVQAASLASYSVRVTNLAGQAWSAGAGLTLKNSNGSQNYPQFLLQPSNQIANAGATLTFTAAVAPAGVTLQWRKDSANISAATNASFTITNVSFANEGVYTLIASNSTGRAASQGARLTIRQGPVFTQQPTSVAVVAGAPAVFEAAAVGTDPLLYQWRKDGQPISGGTGRRLFFTSVNEADTGTYTLIVSNLAGSVTSAPVTLSLAASLATTWRQLEPGQDMNHLTCAAGTPNGIYLAGDNGAFSISSDGGRTWSRLRPAGGGLGQFLGGITGVAYGGGRYVAVGWDKPANDNFSITSSDGIHWTRHPQSGVPKDLRYNGSIFYGMIGGIFFSSPDGIVWTQQYVGEASAVCHGAGRFVGIGGLGTILTSTNGTDWTSVPVNTTEGLIGVCHGPAGFVAVGESGTMVTSSNGLVWTVLPRTTFQRLYDVASGNGRYVAVGGSIFVGAKQPAVTLVSTDGVNWKRTSNHANDSLLGVTYANGVFVAYGGYGYVLTSEDGEEWVLRRPPDTELLCGIAEGNGLFVSVGFYGLMRNSEDGEHWNTVRAPQSENFGSIGFGAGRFVIGVDDGGLFTSSDGNNWQRQITAAGVIGCVRYVNGRFFTLTDSGEILHSPDGLGWTMTRTATGAPLKHIAWSGSLYAAAGFDGAIVTSPDGENWTLQSTPTRVPLFGIAYGAGRFLAVGSENTVLTSTDGVSWARGVLDTNVHLFGITYANGQFVGGGYDGVIMTSPDGVSWTQRASGTTVTFTRVEFLNGKYVATGSGTIAESSDGVTWSVRTVGYVLDTAYGNGQYIATGPYAWLWGGSSLATMSQRTLDSLTSYALYEVKFQGGRFVAGGNGRILTSLDGKQWTARSNGVGGAIMTLAYGAGRHVATGNGSHVLHSLDAATWSSAFVGPFTFDGLVFGGGQFVAAGSSGGIATSPDGLTWTPRASPVTSWLDDIAFGNNTYVAISSSHIVFSTNGIDWGLAYVRDLNDGPMQNIVFSGGRFIVAVQFGTMLTSSNGVDWASGWRDTGTTIQGMADYQGVTFGVGEFGVIAVSAPAPVITTQPLSQQVRVGSPVALSVTVTNAPRARYQWFKDGQPLEGATGPALAWARIGPSHAGSYFVRVSSFGSATESIRAVITVTQQPFDAWRIGHFGESNFLDAAGEMTLWGPLADPDSDRLPNIAEYAYGTSPTTNTARPLSLDVSTGRLRVTFVRRRNDPALTVTPEVSGDLESWRGGAGHVEEATVVPINSELERVTVADVESVLPGAPRFIRLRIQLLQN